MTQPSPVTPTSTAPVVELLDAAIAETRRLDRSDLAGRLTAERQHVTTGAWHVLVAGEFKKGKSAVVNALLGIPVCSVDAVAFTAVPTIIRYGQTPSAALVLNGEEDGAADVSPNRRPIAARSASAYTRSGVDDDGARLRAVEVMLPRELLRSGLVLVDTPGLGGGFAAAQAAATMRAMSLADAVLIVSDASQEYTAAEVEFLQHAKKVCPYLLCLLTKTDFYPEWRRILDIDRGHLRQAGLDIEIIPVSAALRELAIDTGDQALNSESGFPVVVDRLRSQLAGRRTEVLGGQAVAAVRSSLRQVAGTLAAEHVALTRPDERPATLHRLDEAQRKAERLTNSSSRWLNTITDRFADIQSRHDSDLQARIRRLEKDATERIKAGDPARDWTEIMPWIHRRANEELTDCHTRLLALIDEVAGEIAALFADSAAGIGAVGADAWRPTGDAPTLTPLSVRGPSRLEVGMQAARGWSLSSSVVTTLLVATLHPALLVVLPVTAVLGTVFSIKTVHSFKTSRVEAARAESLRAVAAYLNQARADASRASADLLRHSRSRIRDYYLDRANELLSTTRRERAATLHAAEADDRSVQRRTSQTETDLLRVRKLLDTAEHVLTERPSPVAAQ